MQCESSRTRTTTIVSVLVACVNQAVCVAQSGLANDTSYFSDATCTRQLVTGDGCKAPVAYLARAQITSPDGQTGYLCPTELDAIAPYSSSRVFQNALGACAPPGVGPAGPPPSALYSVGAAIDPESVFAPLTPQDL